MKSGPCGLLNNFPSLRYKLGMEGVVMANGMLVFRSIGEARRAGFEIYDRTAHGFIVRTAVDGHWQMALVELPV